MQILNVVELRTKSMPFALHAFCLFHYTHSKHDNTLHMDTLLRAVEGSRVFLVKQVCSKCVLYKQYCFEQGWLAGTSMNNRLFLSVTLFQGTTGFWKSKLLIQEKSQYKITSSVTPANMWLCGSKVHTSSSGHVKGTDHI